MDIVIIEDQPIIAEAICRDFQKTSNGTLTITTLTTLDELKQFDFNGCQFIISDLYLGTSIHETMHELYKLRTLHPDVSISVFTQSTDIPNLEAFLALIKANHLFDKRFISDIAHIVLHEEPQQFHANKTELAKAEAFLKIDGKAQSILEELAKHEPLTSIAIESNKSKSAISQVIKRIENQIGSKRHFLQLFFKQF
jgi:DNA-binding NarL/FixJ family response regulator